MLTCASRRGVLRQVLRPRPRDRQAGRARPGGRRHRRAVDRRAGHAADDAHVPHRRHGVARSPSSRRSDARHAGIVALPGTHRRGRPSADQDGKLVVMNRSGSRRRPGREGARPRALPDRLRRAPQGARTAQTVEQGQILVEWDPYTFSILTEEAGQIASSRTSSNGITVHEEVDEVTGLSRLIIVDSPDEKKQPTVEITRQRRARSPRSYHMPSHAHLMVRGRRAGLRRARCWRRSRARPRRRRTSRAVCRAWSSCSRRASRSDTARSSARSTASVKHGGIVKGQRKIIIVPDEPGAGAAR